MWKKSNVLKYFSLFWIYKHLVFVNINKTLVHNSSVTEMQWTLERSYSTHEHLKMCTIMYKLTLNSWGNNMQIIMSWLKMLKTAISTWL